MSRIKQLDKHLINQIAAGEVIERPSSVVKELVENSIDAGSTRVSIEIANECRDIRIADNGCGIHPDDITLAFSKHATSKIQTNDDLYSIHTLGFRGEALSSIISISKLTCTTRIKENDYGVRVECENSEVKNTKTGCAVGTIMEVKNLFYNIPARLKFLKSAKTEFAYIQELIQSLALANPSVSIELRFNGKIALKTTGSKNLLQSIKEIYSKEVTEHLKEVLRTDKLSNLSISGYISTPDYTRASKKGYHLYINSRTVKCPVMQKAIDVAYKNMMGSGKYPFIILNLEIPPTDVDVNVHPTKKEVRYKNTNQIFNFIYSAVNTSLSSFSTPIDDRFKEDLKLLTFPKTSPTTTSQQTNENDNDTVYVEDFEQKAYEKVEYTKNITKPEINVHQATFVDKNESQNEAIENIIGQYKDTYILIEKENGLEIVDQHIADERYIYETLKARHKIASQILFVSDILSVSQSEMERLKENIKIFENIGYEIEFINNTDLIFKKIPQMIAKINPKEILADILNSMTDDISQLEEKILITTSCKAAVKANTHLSMWQMQEIIKKWRTCKNPYTCPHGRPISKLLTHKEIASFFERNK